MARPLPSGLSWTVLIGFAAALAVAYFVVPVPLWIVGLYAVLSLIAFAAYGIDKSAARKNAQRVSEDTLLTLGLIGGWPGALVAQQVFRHKTRKRSFRRMFWVTVVVNVLALGGVIALAVANGWNLNAPWEWVAGLLG
jgi:uncharacterized membrane protein YsdA (DUF1294 family)